MMGKPPAKLYLVIANISKRCNIRSLIASAVAFGAEVLIVGQPKFSMETHAPSRLPPGFSVRRFADLPSCRDFIHSAGGTLVGVEIGDGAKNVDEEPFTGTCAFMPGNEGSGMSEQQKACCDSFVYISQHGGGIASLNVTVAASIILHRFASWRAPGGVGGGVGVGGGDGGVGGGVGDGVGGGGGGCGGDGGGSGGGSGAAAASATRNSVVAVQTTL